jgi:2-carboxy-1,4-naphthoquinone phytyltransferase
VAAAFTAMYRSIDATLPAWQLLQQNSALLTPVMVVCGLTTTAILFCSHFHQIEGDKQAGKLSPLVRLGTATGCQVSCSP